MGSQDSEKMEMLELLGSKTFPIVFTLFFVPRRYMPGILLQEDASILLLHRLQKRTNQTKTLKWSRG